MYWHEKYVFLKIKQTGGLDDLEFIRKIAVVHNNTVKFDTDITAGKSNISEINKWIDVNALYPEGEVMALNDSEDILIGYLSLDEGVFTCENEHELMEDVKFWRPLPFTHRERKAIFNDF